MPLIRPIDIREWDEILITGLCRSCTRGTGMPVRVERMAGTAGCVSPAGESGPAAVKVWPDDPAADPDGCGKMWFALDEIEAVELVHRDEEE